VQLFVMPSANAVARALGWLRPGGGTGLLVNFMNRGIAGSWQAFQEYRSQLPETRQQDVWLLFGLAGYELAFVALTNLGVVFGVIKCLRIKRWSLLLLCIIVIGFFAAGTGPIGFEARYRLPFMPYMILLALQNIPWSVSHLANRR
jgi:hypothetical protein